MKPHTRTLQPELSLSDPRVKLITAKIRREGHKPDSLIEVLHTAQNAYGYLPGPVLRYITHELHLPPSRVFSTVTFYHFFSLRPKGEHSCLVCTGTACYVKGAQKILDSIEDRFGLQPGQVSAGGKLGLQTARCIGACGLAPAVVLDEEVLGRVDSGGLISLIQQKTGLL